MSNTNEEIAFTIAQQLGGVGSLAVLIGAKNFLATESGLSFKLGRGAKNGITHCTITLEADDTYTVRFLRCWGAKATDKGVFTGVYNDMLVSLFESRTGFFLSLLGI